MGFTTSVYDVAGRNRPSYGYAGTFRPGDQEREAPVPKPMPKVPGQAELMALSQGEGGFFNSERSVPNAHELADCMMRSRTGTGYAYCARVLLRLFKGEELPSDEVQLVRDGVKRYIQSQPGSPTGARLKTTIDGFFDSLMAFCAEVRSRASNDQSSGEFEEPAVTS